MTRTDVIVGTHFYPPSYRLLKIVPLNAALFLRREPHNQYDSNAIAVYMNIESIMELSSKPMKDEIEFAFHQSAERHDNCPDFISTLKEGELKIGHLTKEIAAELKDLVGGFVPGKLRLLNKTTKRGTASSVYAIEFDLED